MRIKGKIVKLLSVIMAVVMVAAVMVGNPLKANAATDRQKYAAVFDAKYYFDNNADVAAAYGNNYNKLLNHYIAFGCAEGRNASAKFNAKAYRENNADLNAAYGDNWAGYHEHFAAFGEKEGRNALGKGGNKKANNNNQQKNNNAVAGQVIGSYTTEYSTKEARATNVFLAAQKLNGTVIQPGAGFSYNGTIGPRTTEAGFVMAPIYTGGKVGKGIGGGICQVSSTLYAAMRTAGLPATERHAHSLPVHYIASGWDATVSWGTLDLKFTNTYNRPLLITASADNGKLTVTLSLK